MIPKRNGPACSKYRGRYSVERWHWGIGELRMIETVPHIRNIRLVCYRRTAWIHTCSTWSDRPQKSLKRLMTNVVRPNKVILERTLHIEHWNIALFHNVLSKGCAGAVWRTHKFRKIYHYFKKCCGRNKELSKALFKMNNAIVMEYDGCILELQAHWNWAELLHKKTLLLPM